MPRTAAGFDRLDFTPAYDVELDPPFPPDGSWRQPVVAFAPDGSAGSEAEWRWGTPTVVRVVPIAVPQWVGMFPGGEMHGLSGAFATPSPLHLCVVTGGAGCMVRVDAPQRGAALLPDVVEQISSVAAPALLLVVTGIDIVALHQDGVAWRSPRLAVDDLRVVNTDAAGIHCTGDLLDDAPVRFVVDPATGGVASGPRLDGPPWNPRPPRDGRRRWRRRRPGGGSGMGAR